MISRTIDKILIPPYLKLQTLFWLNKLPELAAYSPRKVFLNEGHQSKDFLRDYINSHYPIRNSRVLLLGCGNGHEAVTWSAWNPQELVGIDYFDYSESWQEHSMSIKKNRGVAVSFSQTDILHDTGSLNGPFDIISSDAVLEHITDIDKALHKIGNLLNPGGIFYAGFGPLYFTFGGDHYSGWDKLENGFNHLVLAKNEYAEYVTLKNIDSDEHDDRVFIYNNLFSKLKTPEYLELFKQHFSYIDVHMGISSKALDFKSVFPQKWASILKSHKIQESDLLIKCMFILARKPVKKKSP